MELPLRLVTGLGEMELFKEVMALLLERETLSAPALKRPGLRLVGDIGPRSDDRLEAGIGDLMLGWPILEVG